MSIQFFLLLAKHNIYPFPINDIPILNFFLNKYLFYLRRFLKLWPEIYFLYIGNYNETIIIHVLSTPLKKCRVGEMKYFKKRNDNSFLRVLPKSNNGLSKQKKIGQMKIQNTFHK